MEDSRLRIKVGIVILGLICSTFYMYSLFQNMHRKVSVGEYYNWIFKPLKKNRYVYEAIEDNDIKGLKRLIEKEPEKANRANLRYAIENNRLEITEYLISKGADINHVPDISENAGTILQYSIGYGKREAAKLIIQAGADVNLKVKDSYSPLYMAVSRGWFDVTEMLISRGAKIDIDNKTEPLLYAAVEKESKGIVLLLISKCPDIHKLVSAKGNYNDEVPLHVAARTGNLEIGKILVRNGADIDALENRGYSPLEVAIDEGNRQFSKYLIEKGADIYPVTLTNGVRSPVFTAVLRDDADTLKLLLKRGAIPDTRDRWNGTPLYYALYDNNPEISTLLMSAGVCLTEAERRDWEFIGKILDKNCGKTVSLFLKNDINPNMKNVENGDYLIHLAAVNPKALKVLISSGAKVNVKNKMGRTPLFIALGTGNAESANILLKNGANKDTTDKGGKTPLHYAAAKLNFKAVNYLVSNGLKINARDKEGHTPLYRARQYLQQGYYGKENGKRTIELLIALGGIDDSAATKRKKKTILASTKSTIRTSTQLPMTFNKRDFFYAILRDNLGTVKKLLHRCPTLINVRNEEGKTPLHIACSNGSNKITLYLLDQGADINAKDNLGERPIHKAVTGEYERTLRLLLKKGANINAKDNYGETPLHKASCLGHLNILKLLIENGADINTMDDSGETPIYKACYFREEQTLKLLIKAGADVDTKSAFANKNPIHKAISSGNPRLVKILIDSGADLNFPDDDGNTPIHQAILRETPYYADENLSNEMIIITEMLIAKGTALNTPNKDGYSPLHCAIILNKNNIALKLLSRGAGPNSTDKEGRTPLHIAAKCGNFDAVKYLTKYEADVDSKDKLGQTPIHEACYRGYVKIAEILLKKGANIESRDNKGRTPLHCLVNREYREYNRNEKYEYSDYRTGPDNEVFPGYQQTARLLLKKGAKVNARDRDGRTPLYYAKRYGYMKTAKILQGYGGKI